MYKQDWAINNLQLSICHPPPFLSLSLYIYIYIERERKKLLYIYIFLVHWYNFLEAWIAMLINGKSTRILCLSRVYLFNRVIKTVKSIREESEKKFKMFCISYDLTLIWGRSKERFSILQVQTDQWLNKQ